MKAARSAVSGDCHQFDHYPCLEQGGRGGEEGMVGRERERRGEGQGERGREKRIEKKRERREGLREGGKERRVGRKRDKKEEG